MPYITIESGALTSEQKKALIEQLTVTASEITHIPAQFFMVSIKELPDENIGIGGKPIDELKRNYRTWIEYDDNEIKNVLDLLAMYHDDSNVRFTFCGGSSRFGM